MVELSTVEQLANESQYLMGPMQFRSDPRGSLQAHNHRRARLVETPGIEGIVEALYSDPSPKKYMTHEGIERSREGLVFEGEHHRDLSPFLRQVVSTDDLRSRFMGGIDRAVERDTEMLMGGMQNGKRELHCDVLIPAMGLHGIAAAMLIRELFPQLSILGADVASRIGGMPRSYGDNVSFYFNSLWNTANRNFPGIPGSKLGDTNMLGPFSPLHASDIDHRGREYPSNLDVGYPATIGGYLACDRVITGVEYTGCDSVNADGTHTIDGLVHGESGQEFTIHAGAVIEALGPTFGSVFPGLERGLQKGYLTGADFNGHFGNVDGRLAHYPMEAFAGKQVVIIGGMHGMMITAEALTGELPPETYGYGFERSLLPSQIVVVGASGNSPQELYNRLSPRYRKGSFGVELQRQIGGEDELFSVSGMRARDAFQSNGSTTVILDDGSRYQSGVGTVIIDCTNQPPNSIEPSRVGGVYSVGAGYTHEPDQAVEAIIQHLGLPRQANIVGLGATIPRTLQLAYAAGGYASRVKNSIP